MSAHRDPDRLISAFILEGEDQLHDQVYDAVRAAIEQKRQRVVLGPWRVPSMSKVVPIGLAAAVAVAVIIGLRQLAPVQGSVGNVPSAVPSSSLAPSVEPSVSLKPTSSPVALTGLPKGPFVVTGTNDPLEVTVDIAASGWEALAAFDGVTKDDDGQDAPKTVGATLLAWTWPVGTGFNVYKDPCNWRTTIPAKPATTPAQIAAAFAAQTATDATAPVDVTVGGFAGKTLTLHVPMSYDLPNATREEKFTACDDKSFAFYGIEGQTDNARNAQGAGQIDELWILDVNGAIVILDAALSPATPGAVVDEARAMARSATFKAP